MIEHDELTIKCLKKLYSFYYYYIERVEFKQSIDIRKVIVYELYKYTICSYNGVIYILLYIPIKKYIGHRWSGMLMSVR